jgi:hypothetical protein
MANIILKYKLKNTLWKKRHFVLNMGSHVFLQYEQWGGGDRMFSITDVNLWPRFVCRFCILCNMLIILMCLLFIAFCSFCFHCIL